MDDSFPLNLRRLIFFHHASAREAASVMGVSEHAVSAWLTGKRTPGLESLMRIAELYDVDPRKLRGDPIEFARDLADPERVQLAEVNIGHALTGVGATTPLRRRRGGLRAIRPPEQPAPSRVTSLGNRRREHRRPDGGENADEHSD